jgi:hypothetical protein
VRQLAGAAARDRRDVDEVDEQLDVLEPGRHEERVVEEVAVPSSASTRSTTRACTARRLSWTPAKGKVSMPVNSSSRNR